MTRNPQLPFRRLVKFGHVQAQSECRSYGVAGLFAGVGGIELGLQLAGHSSTLLCENDIGARAVLNARFPDTPVHDDVRTLDSIPAGTDLLAAGFPCQDLSQAGKTRGISGDRSGLIGEVFRLLRKQRIPLVLIENVSFMLQLAKGHALRVIVEEFEDLGYKWAYRVLDSRAFGVPQRRERVFFLASLEDDPRDVLLVEDAGEPELPKYSPELAFGFYWTEGIRGLGAAVDGVPTLKGGSTLGIPSAPAILLPDRRVVTPNIRDAERMQGFPPDWTLPASSHCRPGHRWKLVGNAVTVNVARWVGERLRSPGIYDPTWDDVLPDGAPWPRAAWNDGTGRRRADVSSWPVHIEREPLHDFLDYEPALLSARATAGFLDRARRGSLRFPEGFLEALDSHLDSVRSDGSIKVKSVTSKVAKSRARRVDAAKETNVRTSRSASAESRSR